MKGYKTFIDILGVVEILGEKLHVAIDCDYIKDEKLFEFTSVILTIKDAEYRKDRVKIDLNNPAYNFLLTPVLIEQLEEIIIKESII